MIEQGFHKVELLSQQAQKSSMASRTAPSIRSPGRTWPGASPAARARRSSGSLRRNGAEQGVEAVLVAVDGKARRARVVDLHQGQLRHPEGPHPHIEEQGRYPVVGRRAKLHPSP